LSESLTIPLDEPKFYGDMNNFIEAAKGYAGYCLPPEVCEWFSAAIGK